MCRKKDPCDQPPKLHHGSQRDREVYELFKIELKKLFKKEIQNGIVKVCEGRDRKFSEVDVSYKYSNSDTSCSYTINMYNTTSTAMINGRNYIEFQSIAEEILEKLSYQTLQNLNKE